MTNFLWLYNLYSGGVLPLYRGIMSNKPSFEIEGSIMKQAVSWNCFAFIDLIGSRNQHSYAEVAGHTVDGSEIRRSQLLCKIYHDLPGFITIPGGCLGFLPSTVYPHFSSFWLNFILMSMNLPPAPKEWWFWKGILRKLVYILGKFSVIWINCSPPEIWGKTNMLDANVVQNWWNTITNVISSPFLHRSENRWRNSQKVAW